MKDQTNNLIIGVDVSKDKLDFMILPIRFHKIIPNNEKDISLFLKQVVKRGSIRLFVMEPTGGYEKQIVKQLYKQNLPLHLVHPNRIYHFVKSKGCFAKTDKIDAEMLARYGQQEEIQPQVINMHTNVLKELSSRQRQIKAELMRERCRLRHTFYGSFSARSIKKSIKFHEKLLEEVDHEIEKQIEKSEELSDRVRLLQSFKGVGKKIAHTLITDLPELGFLSRKKITRLAGLAPCNKDSGKKIGYRTTIGGRAQIKQGLYMAALVAMRYNANSKAFYQSLIERNKKPKVALIAVMRKMIITLNAMVRDNTTWQERKPVASV
jgi:transposase